MASISRQPTIVNIVEMGKRIVRIIDDERASQAITVLSGEMAVVPEGAYVDGVNRCMD